MVNRIGKSIISIWKSLHNNKESGSVHDGNCSWKKSKFSPEIREHFKNMNLQFSLYPINENKSYKSLNAFYDFVKKQLDYWESCHIGKASEIRNHFSTILSFLDQVEVNQESNLNHSINQLQQAIHYISYNRFPCVFPSPESDFVKEHYDIHPDRADAICNYLLNGTGDNQVHLTWSNPKHIEGLLHTFFYKYPNLQERLFTSLDNSVDLLKNRYVDSLNRVDEEYFEKMESVKQTNNTFISETENWKEEITTSTSKFVNEKKDELSELIGLYEEKLKLEAPAKYWEETAQEYNEKGKRWILVTIASSLVFIGLLTAILFLLPNPPTTLSFTSFKMTIILTVIISAGLFIINFFIRLAMSAYHLATDAKERNKLTYVYLALLKDKNVEESDRSIVLQALFSRADSGLLKGDSSPTLPDGLVGQALKSLGQPK